jgi:hypothetical protein
MNDERVQIWEKAAMRISKILPGVHMRRLKENHATLSPVIRPTSKQCASRRNKSVSLPLKVAVVRFRAPVSYSRRPGYTYQLGGRLS